MKSVLPKLQKFGEEDGNEGEPLSTPPLSSKLRRNSRASAKPGFRRAGEQIGLEAVGSASKINLTCTNSAREQTRSRLAAESSQHHSKKVPDLASAASAAPYEELRKVQRETQQKQHPDDLSQFTLCGQGQAETPHPDESNDLTVLSIPREISGLDLEGASEWMAVPWEIPNPTAQSDHLACLLLCKGVEKAQLPRMNIADWKPGSLGVPTFHCMRCFQRWMRKGGVPEMCSEQEMTTEGPAMCMTVQSRDSPGNIVIGGLLGEDGKPVKIRVEEPKIIAQLLQKERKQKLVKSRAKNSSKQDSEVQDESFESDEYELSSNDNLLDLPDAFKTHILNQETSRQTKYYAHSDSQTDGYMQHYDSSSFNSLDASSNSSLGLSSSEIVTTGSRASLSQKRRQQNANASAREKKTLKANQSWTSFDGDKPHTSQKDTQRRKSSHASNTATHPKHQKMKSKSIHRTKNRPSSNTLHDSSNITELTNAHQTTTSRRPSKHSLLSRASSTQTVYLESIQPNSASSVTSRTRQQNSSPSGASDKQRGHGNRRSNKEEEIHLPSIVDNTIPRTPNSQQQNPVPPFEPRPGTSTTENSDVNTHLPTLSPRTNLVQQEAANDTGLTTVNQGYSQQEPTNYFNDESNHQQPFTRNGFDISSIEAGYSHQNDNTQTTQSQTTAASEMEPAVTESLSGNVPQPQSQEPDPSSEEATLAKATNNKPTPMKKQAAKLTSAVVKQEFDVSRKGSESNQMRIRRKSRWGEETPQVPSSTSNHISSSFTQLPNRRSSISQTNIQRLPSFHADDIPRRFGQKIVKKTKKVEAEPKQGANYNSKDLGNLIGNSSVDIDADGRSASRRSSLGLDRGESSRQSLAARILRRAQQHQEYSNIPMPIMGRSNSSASRPSSSGLGPRIPNNKPASNLLKDSTTVPSTPQALVRLKPLEPTNPAPENSPTVEQPLDDIEQQVAELLKMADTTCEPEEQAEERESEDSGLEDISEESEEEEDDDEFDFEVPKPIPELKDITPMSFTSSYAFSFYKMGGPYRQVYNKTHARSLEPLRVRRRKKKPPKVRRKKVK